MAALHCVQDKAALLAQDLARPGSACEHGVAGPSERLGAPHRTRIARRARAQGDEPHRKAGGKSGIREPARGSGRACRGVTTSARNRMPIHTTSAFFTVPSTCRPRAPLSDCHSRTSYALLQPPIGAPDRRSTVWGRCRVLAAGMLAGDRVC